MKRLSYNDLLALVIEYDIDSTLEQLRILRQQKRADNNVEIKEATNDDVLKYHSK